MNLIRLLLHLECLHNFWHISTVVMLLIFLLITCIWQRQYQCSMVENRIAQMPKGSLSFNVNTLDKLPHYLILCFKRICLQLSLFCSTHGSALHSNCLPVVFREFSRLFFIFRKFALFHVQPPLNILTAL